MKKPLLCRLFGHAPGEETWPIGVSWCRRCGAKCTRYGREFPELSGSDNSRRCPCYLHYHRPMALRDAYPCICECEVHEASDNPTPPGVES